MVGGGALAATVLAATVADQPVPRADAAMDERVDRGARSGDAHGGRRARHRPTRPPSPTGDRASSTIAPSSWRTMRLDACEASKVRHDEDDATTALASRASITASPACAPRSTLLTGGADATVRANALAISRSGTDATDCTSAGTIGGTAAIEPPPDLERQLADLDAQAEAGNDSVVMSKGPALATALEAAGDVDGAAEVWFRIALSGTGLPSSQGVEAARKAAQLATQAGDDDLGAQAWAIAAQRASDSGELEGVDDFLTLATASAAKSPRPMTRMMVDISRAWVEKHRTHSDVSIKLCQQVLDDATSIYGPDAEPIGGALGCLFNLAYQRDDFDAAGRYADQRLAYLTRVYGPESTEYLDGALDVAMVKAWKDPTGALAQFQQLIVRETAVYGADSVTVLEAWYELAATESKDGALATPAALDASKHAADLAMRILPVDDLKRARILANRGDVLADSGDSKAAAALYERVLATYDRIKNQHMWAPLAYNAADLYRRSNDCARRSRCSSGWCSSPTPASSIATWARRRADRWAPARWRPATTPTGSRSSRPRAPILEALGAASFLAEFRLEGSERVLEARRLRAGARPLAQQVTAAAATGDDGWQGQAEDRGRAVPREGQMSATRDDDDVGRAATAVDDPEARAVRGAPTQTAGTDAGIAVTVPGKQAQRRATRTSWTRRRDHRPLPGAAPSSAPAAWAWCTRRAIPRSSARSRSRCCRRATTAPAPRGAAAARGAGAGPARSPQRGRGLRRRRRRAQPVRRDAAGRRRDARRSGSTRCGRRRRECSSCSSTPGAGWPPRTPPASCTATSSRQRAGRRRRSRLRR